MNIKPFYENFLAGFSDPEALNIYTLLARLVDAVNPSHVLDLGTGEGWSVRAMIQLMKQGTRLTTIGIPGDGDKIGPWRGDKRLKEFHVHSLEEHDGVQSTIIHDPDLLVMNIDLFTSPRDVLKKWLPKIAKEAHGCIWSMTQEPYWMPLGLDVPPGFKFQLGPVHGILFNKT